MCNKNSNYVYIYYICILSIQGFKNTGAALRGEQLLNYIRGKRTGEQVVADTLVDKHNFDIPLLDTLTINGGEEETGYY